MMTIFHINVSFTMGGLETMLVDIMNKQCKYAKVHLLIVNNKVDYSLLNNLDKSVECHFINRREGSLLPLFLLKINYILLKNKPDVIHCHHFKVGKAILRAYKCGLFLTVHDMRFEPRNYQLYDTIFAISHAVADDINKRSGYKAEVVYNGINFDKIKKRSNLERTNKRFNIIHISRLVHLKKGQDILLKAVKKLRDEYNYDIGITFIGDGESGDYLQQLTRELDMGQCVEFAGNKDRAFIYDNLHKYDLLVQPSLYEGFGLTVIEGIAANIPVVAADVDGPKEIAEELDYNFLCKSGSVEHLATAIASVYNRQLNEPHVFQAELEQLNVKAEKKFSLENTTSQYLYYYKKQLENI